jgi:hypothetical protein
LRIFVLEQQSGRLYFTMRLRGKGRRNGKVYSDTLWHSIEMAFGSQVVQSEKDKMITYARYSARFEIMH